MTRKYTKRIKPVVETGIIGEPITITSENIQEMINTVVKLPEEQPIGNVNNCEYKLVMIFNGQTLECYTNNLKISILSFAREVLTEMYVKITVRQHEFEKRLSLVQGKKLLVDEQSLDIFLETFYGLYGQPTKIK